MTTTQDERPLTVAEAADWLKTSPSTIYAMVSEGKLRHYRVGTGRGSIRITKKALSALELEGGKRDVTKVTLKDLKAAL